MSVDDTIASLLQPRLRSAAYAPREQSSAEAQGDGEDYSAFARGRVGLRPQMMVAFRKCTGETLVFAYSQLIRMQTRNPDRGCTMTFGSGEVSIEGEHLGQLFNYLREHRAVEIIESDRTALFGADDSPIVSRLTWALPSTQQPHSTAAGR